MIKKTLSNQMNAFKRKKLVNILLVCFFITVNTMVLIDNVYGRNEYSPIIEKLKDLYEKNPEILDKAFANAVTPPTGTCSKSPVTGEPFCWKGKKIEDLLQFFEKWLNFTPTPKNDGFAYYQLLYDFCYNNMYAIQFVETEPWLSWTSNFTIERGKRMNDSVDPKVIKEWKEFLGPQWNEYKIPKEGFQTFNEFFTRELKTPRKPQGDETILVAPADSLINSINSNLTATTQINTKYYENLNVRQLLDGSQYADAFNGGTAISCVLLPTVYHWYHSPVGGTVIESRAIPGASFGMNGGFYTFLNNGNFGGYKSNFGVFGIYHRGYYIIRTEKYGLVAMIPVGLDDVNSVNFYDKLNDIPKVNPIKRIAKGDKLGYFAYGGSLVILLFEPGVFSGLKVEQGQQIGIMNQIQ